MPTASETTTFNLSESEAGAVLDGTVVGEGAGVEGDVSVGEGLGVDEGAGHGKILQLSNDRLSRSAGRQMLKEVSRHRPPSM